MEIDLKIAIQIHVMWRRRRISISRYLGEDYDIEDDDEYIERVCVVNWDSLPIYNDYPKDYSQGDKIELDENKVMYIKVSP